MTLNRWARAITVLGLILTFLGLIPFMITVFTMAGVTPIGIALLGLTFLGIMVDICAVILWIIVLIGHYA